MKLIEKVYFNNRMNLILLNFIILTTVGFSQSFGWQENGVPVRQGAHIEWSRTGDVGENGTMIFGWTDTRTGDRDVYAQKFDSDGNKLWDEDGLIVIRFSGRQEDPIFISDDGGGVYVIWSDFRNEPISDGQPYAQHVNSNGVLTWGEDGMPLSSDKLTEFSLNLCKDGTGGAYALWKNKYGGHYASYLNFSNSGPTNKVEVISNEWSHSNPSLETAGNGDAVMVWKDERNEDKDLYGQRLGFDGTNVVLEWETIEDDDYGILSEEDCEIDDDYGILSEEDCEIDDDYGILSEEDCANIDGSVWYGEGNSEEVDDCGDGIVDSVWYGEENSGETNNCGDGIVDSVWYGEENSEEVDNCGDGEDNYPNGGISVVTAIGDQSSQKVTYYSEEYSVIVWQDERNQYGASFPDIFATFLNENGDPAPYYGVNGLPIVTSHDLNGGFTPPPSAQKKPRVKADGNGAMVIWNDFRNDPSGDVYIQKITHESNGLWAHSSDLPFDGVVVSEGMGEQGNSRLSIDGNGGVFVVWENKPSEETDIYIQHLDVDGNPSFADDGIIICNAVNDQISPLVRLDGNTGAFSVWQDQRDGSIGLYVQHVEPSSGVTFNEDGIEMYFGIDGHGQLYNDTDPLQMTQKSLYLGDDRTLLFWEDKRFGNQNIDNLNISTSYVFGEIIESHFGSMGTLNGEKLSESPVQIKPSVNALEDGYLYNFIGQDLSSGENVLKSELLDTDLNSISSSIELVDGTDWANQKTFMVGRDLENNQFVFYAKEYWDPSSIWLQVYNSNGVELLSNPVNIVSNSDLNNYYPRAVFQNPTGGMILVFDQNENDIRIIGVYSNGDSWEEAISIITNTEDQLFQDATKTQEGIFITWKDLRGEDADIFGQHISYGGIILSSEPNGIHLCEESNDQNGANTTFVESTNTVTTCWEDFRNGSHWDTYCRDVDLTTNTVNDELILSDAIGDQMNPFLFTSLTNTVLAVWEDFRNGNNEYADIYFQEIENGAMNFGGGGIAVCDEFHNQINPRIDILTETSDISYLIYWDDMRSSGKEDLINVFSQQIILEDCNGEMGGSAIIDNCGVCGGDDSTCSDCAGALGGNAYLNQCETCICNGSDSLDGFECIESEECVQDCNNEWGGFAETDDCGVCDADVTNNNTTCTQDCVGVWDGTSEFDNCGVCGGNDCFEQDCDTYPSDEYDCDGVTLSVGESLPIEFGLKQNYPNPFNPSTSISFSIPRFSMVSISIYNVNGQKVKLLIENTMSPGNHHISWYGDDDNGISVSNGIYFYIMETTNFIGKRKMLFIK